MEKIQVGVRLRSLLEGEKSSYWCVKENSINQKRAPGQQFTSETYQFDHVFGPDAQTTEIFDVLGKPIVEGVINGVNGTIFAYGQTNSGKTYTMTGEQGQGVIPMSCIYLFDRMEELNDRDFLIRLSYLEIYNEQLTDLINPDPYRRLKIRENTQRIIPIFVDGLQEESISSIYDIPHLLEMGHRNRTVGETLMNKQSSRSHSLLAITVESRKKENDESVRLATLNLVDLAGSERARSTGAKGVRLTESTYINKSLFTLGSVISKLSDGKSHSHIPYRDSKLTRILQPSLGGNAMTAIICTVSPVAIEESHSTLQFATRAKKISNKPVVNEVVIGEEELRKRLDVAASKISKLKEQLASSTSDQEKQTLLEKLAASERLREELRDRNEMLEDMIAQPARNRQDKHRHTMFCLPKTMDDASVTLPGLPLTPAVYLSPATDRRKTRVIHSSFLPMHPLSLATSAFSPTDTEELNEPQNDDFFSPSLPLISTTDMSTQTPSSLEKDPIISTVSPSLEQSTQTEEVTVSPNHSNAPATAGGHMVFTLDQSTQSQEAAFSATGRVLSCNQSTQTPSLREVIVSNTTAGGCMLSSLDLSCDHRHLLKVVEEDLEIVEYEKNEVLMTNEHLESVVTDLQQTLAQSAERSDISMVEKQELNAGLKQLQLRFEKADQFAVDVIQQNALLKAERAELQMHCEDMEQKLAELQVQCEGLEQKSRLQESQLADRDTSIAHLQEELAEKTKLFASHMEELNAVKEKLHNDQDKAQKIEINVEEELTVKMEQLEQQMTTVKAKLQHEENMSSYYTIELSKAQKIEMEMEEEITEKDTKIQQLEQQLAEKTHSLTSQVEELTAVKGKLQHEEKMSNYYTIELSKAQKIEMEMEEEITEKDAKIQQLEQQLAERQSRHTEELATLKRKLKREEDMSNYCSIELRKAQKIEMEMEEEITEKDTKIQQLEQQLAEKSVTSHMEEELAALKGKLKHEEDMSRFYTVELNKAQKIEREMEEEITEKDTKIQQLEQQLAEKSVTSHMEEELAALKGKLKHEEDMSRFYTVELNKAQKIEREMEDEITEKDDRIAQLEQQLGALEGKLKHEEDMSHFYTVELNKAQKIEREMEDEITEKDDRIAQLEQQLKEKEGEVRQARIELRHVNSSLPPAATSLPDQEQLECPKPQVTTVSARRRPLVQKLQPSSSSVVDMVPPDINTSYTRDELILKIQVLERQLAHASGGAIIGMQIRVNELEKENDRLRRQVQIEACRHRDYRSIELPTAVSVMKFDEVRCELKDLQQKSESDKQKLSKLMSENSRLKEALESESELSKRYRYERSVYRSKYEHVKSQGAEVAGHQQTASAATSLPPPEPSCQVPRPEWHQEIHPPTAPLPPNDKPNECKPQ